MITEILKNRFCQNMTRHPDLEWDFVEDRLNENKEVLEVLKRMEESGGEPDAIGIDESSGKMQELGPFDQKTSSWIATPYDVRSKGGALFCERRYGVVFTFHNGADSYYSVRGWRGYITV